MGTRRRLVFTLVELLVVIAIIGIHRGLRRWRLSIRRGKAACCVKRQNNLKGKPPLAVNAYP